MVGCVHACMRVCMRACVRACVHSCMRACMHACLCACAHVHCLVVINTCVSIYMCCCLLTLHIVQAMPGAHALLLASGSPTGRTSLVKLVTYFANFKVF